MKLSTKLAAFLVLICFSTAAAQDAICTPMIEQALTAVDTACAPTGRNQACYGNVSLLATAREGVQNFTFEKQGDLADVASVASLQLQQLDVTQNIWGIALMKLQANLPDTLPGQNVTVVLFGDVKIENAADNANVTLIDVTAQADSNIRSGPGSAYRVLGPLRKSDTASANGRTADNNWLRIQIPGTSSLGWVSAGYMTPSGDLNLLEVVDAANAEVPFKPMQAFYFASGIGQSTCTKAPDSGILIQTPQGAGKINLFANDVAIELGSTAFLQAVPNFAMKISVVEGEGKVTSAGKTVTVPAGSQVDVPLNADGKASGQPGAPQAYNADKMALLPVSLLERPITIAQPGAAPIAKPTQIYPTWTRAPKNPTATTEAVEQVATATEVYDTPTATYEPPTEVYEPPTEVYEPPPTEEVTY